MTTLEDDLARVRADLRAAVLRDIRRRKRRRRIARLGIVPAVVLTGAGAAVAFAPQLGDPPPESVTDRIDSDVARLREQAGPKVAQHLNAPDGRRLTLAAIGEHTLIYGALEPSGAWCAVDTTKAGQLQGWTCHEAAKAGRVDEVVLMALGGGSAPMPNYVTGRVGHPAARTVRVHPPGQGVTVEAPVQRLGFFIADLPNSPRRSEPAPSVPSAEALDADGNVVARSS